MKNLTLTLIALITIGLMISCQEEELKLPTKPDGNEPETESQRAQYAYYGWIDIDIDLPAIRGLVRIYPVGPCEDEFGNSIPCDPVSETIVPCRFPNGFCRTIIVTGSTSGGGGNGDPVEINSGDIGIVNIALDKRDAPSYKEVLKQLKEDEEVQSDDKESLAKAIVNTISFAEDSPLSDKLVEQFREKSKNSEFKRMMILAGDYEIQYNEENPYGYIKAYVKVL
ncbi:hypothetical protein MATR_02530 [Marivirga tractuosa]|uniref:Lipoprotein n=1 Tax=Marivirga tractuosa (strain ATCC 23168 / DSM 4126 / NBRC 15989 / NCIMB 1408 / VKM B-1430 / H-43) TaxID=643867 RepID=E4TV17_MARTH|nr:hypothetical protein [Marivirga tractuosa]ADR22110.1 hypothetical protein Ftrac_2128 [Marivirga tractuosa DSM 4126]BDD13428.1 hypothetical protein MATR_02530 [Marivirga tractuosa]